MTDMEAVESLYFAALDKPTAERSAFLDAACGGDQDLRASVERMLAAQARIGGFLNLAHTRVREATPPNDLNPSQVRTILHRPDVRRVAPPDASAIPGYEITGFIARGGMGAVFAGYDLTLDREVAIKTLLPAANPDRFVTEAKLAARLMHPGIPPVYALGALPDGGHYLVMKLIRGRTLADLLQDRPSPTAELPRFLQVFEQTAQSVGFAHSQGILHRDLKPANIMVGEFGEVQVMDWGLAKDQRARVADAQNAGASPNTPGRTRAGSIMGTPPYMAPEQARGEVVDTRADVFALGSVLAVVLTGQPAFVGSTVKEITGKAAAADLTDVFDRLANCGADVELIALARRCLAADAADRPTDARIVAEEVAKHREGVEARLRQAELDRVKAEGERATAEARAEEEAKTRRLAEEKAVEQRKRRRFVQRASAMIVALLLLGILGTTLGLLEAREAKEDADEKRQQAERNLAYARKGNEILGSVFAELDPKVIAESGRPLQDVLRQNLIRAVKELDGSAIDDPLEVAAMQNTLGWSLLALGESELAVEVFQKARDTRKTKLGPDHPDTLTIMSSLASGYRNAGKPDQALPLFEETLELMKAKLGPDHPHTLNTMNHLAGVYRDAGKLDQALPLSEETLKLTKAKLGPDHPHTLTSMNNLAVCLLDAGKLDQALPLFEETLKLTKAKLGPGHPHTLSTMNSLADCYRAAWKLDWALPLFEETLRLRRAKLGPDHPNTLTTMNDQALWLLDAGKFDQALPLLEGTLRLRKAKLGPDHPDTLTSMNNLAMGFLNAGKLDQALPLFEETLKLTKAKLGPDHPHTLSTMNNLALGFLAVGKFNQALPLFEETLKLTKAKLGPDHPDTLNSMNNLAGGYRDAGKPDQALPLFAKTLELMKAKLGPDHPYTLGTMNNLAMGYWATGRRDQALPLFEETLKLTKAKFGPDHPHTLTRTGNLGAVYCEAGQGQKAAETLTAFVAGHRKCAAKDDPSFAGLLAAVSLDLLKVRQHATAEELLQECLAIHQKTQPDAWTTFNTQSLLGGALLGQKKFADAEPLLLKGYEGMKAREKSILPQGSTLIPEALDRLIEFSTATNKPDEVKKWRAERAKYPPPVAPMPREVKK